MSCCAKDAPCRGAAKIIGLSRSGKSREAVYDALYPIGDLDAVLCETELLVMALPGYGTD